VEVETRKDVPEKRAPSPPQAITPGGKEEDIGTDVYGRDETWWRERVRPWKEQLKEATENYERVREEYMKQAEGLGPYNFGKMSLTQYQMLSSRLNILNNDIEKYRAQMVEANEMLEKLSKEAKETKADPAWLE
jgi:chromosome segregation ATPase